MKISLNFRPDDEIMANEVRYTSGMKFRNFKTPYKYSVVNTKCSRHKIIT